MGSTLYTRCFKYVLDKLLAVAILILSWWLFALCAVAVWIDDGFPVIYRQERVGERGRRFMVCKFRTMIRGADQIGPSWTDTNDSRVTSVGKILRSTSLDEIPQIFNILLGDMSLVGYRPDVPRNGEDYSREKYQLRPGITGMAQVNGRSELTPEQKEYWENEYVKRVSFMTDVGILCKTVAVVLKRNGSN